MDERESINFIEVVTNATNLASGSIETIDLATIRSKYGNNFNTLIVTQTGSEDISLHLDGVEISYVTGNKGVFSIDNRDGLIYSILEIKNEGATAMTAGDVKISVGRTGV